MWVLIIERGVVVDLVPGHIRTGQGRLDQVFGVSPVAGEHDRDPEHGRPAGDNVFTEGGIVVADRGILVIADEAHADYLT
jgi:hypothetical protein